MAAETPSIVQDSLRAAAWGAITDERIDWLTTRFPTAVGDPSNATLRALLADSTAHFAHGDRIDGEVLPDWYNEHEAIGYHRLSSDSLWLIDALARYEGVVIIARDQLRLRCGMHRVRTADGDPEEPQHVIGAINCFISMSQLRGWMAGGGAAPPSS